MADQNGIGSRLDTGGEGEIIAGLEGLIGALVNGYTGVGIHIIPIAGEVLEDGTNALCIHGFHHVGHIFRGGLGVLAKGAVIDKVVGIGGYISHRSQIDIYTQSQEGHTLLTGILNDAVHAALGKEGLGREAAVGEKIGVRAGTYHGAALLIGADEQRHAGCALIGADVVADLLGGFVFKITTKENVSAQFILGYRLNRTCVRAADKEHLAHLFLHSHSGEQFLNDLVLIFCGTGSDAGIRL